MPDTMMPSSSVALDALLSRASVPARTLLAPGPDERTLGVAVAAALRAPDHGGLRPWRFVVIEGEGRAKLGALLADALAARAPDTPAERLQLEREKPLRAPTVVVAGAAIRHGHKIPVWEQEAAAAAGTMNFIHALEMSGFGGMWVSSDGLRDPAVKVGLGFAAADTLIGWLYVGTPPAERPRPERADPAGFFRRWG